MTPPFALHHIVEMVVLFAIIAAEFWWFWKQERKRT